MSIRKLAHPFAAPQNGVAVVHLIITTALYFGAIALGTLYFGNYAMMALAIVLFTGGGIRYFGAQHDCGHAAHFSNRRVNTVVGVLLGAFTAHPFFAMRYNHNLHHRHIGNLDEREAHEVLTWTVAEYQAASIWGKLFYRTYRSAPVIYFFGPIFIFFFRYGSSVLDFGPIFHFLTYNFAFHDLHHLYVKIPAYRLKACHEALADELQPTRMGIKQPVALHPAE